MVSDLNQMAILKFVDKVATILINPCSNLSLGNISTVNNSPFVELLAGARVWRGGELCEHKDHPEAGGLQTFLSCLVNFPFTQSRFDNFKFS